MVASSKLHHAQTAIQNMLPYENLLEHILKSFLVSMPDAAEGDLTEERKDIKSVALVVYSSNSSLCGGYNNNVIRKMQHAIDGYHAQGINNITIYPIGRKVAEKVKSLGLKSAGDFVALADKPNATECRNIAEELIGKYSKREYDKVELIYHHFKSAASQVLTRRNFLPVDLSTEKIGAYNDRDLSSNLATAKAQEYLRKNGKAATKSSTDAVPLNDDFIVEPDIKTVLDELVPKALDLIIYTALLDSNASEHAARMVAMQAATDNADELLKELNLQYNKSRQAAITNELLDIVGGSANN